MSTRCGRGIVVLLVVLLASSVVASPSAGQEDQPGAGSIQISVRGESRAGFVPRDEPYVDGGPRVAIPAKPVDEILAKDGRPVTAVEFIGWEECGGVRIMAFGLPELGFEDTGKFLASVLVEWNSETEFRALDLLGIVHVVVEAGPPPEGLVASRDIGCNTR